MRYKLIVSYDGSLYCGFQKQINEKTIQEELENALYQVFKKPVTINASGRTDAGVSAIAQMCHFDVEEEFDEHKTMKYLNVLLSEAVKVLEIKKTTEDFHARKTAKKKTYEYWFYVGNEIPIYEKIAQNIGYNINIDEMRVACKNFIGEHDFSAFCASNTSIKDKVRTIYDMDIVKVDDALYKLVVIGNGFLYNMVRIIMGTLVSVGLGKLKAKDVVDIVKSKDRANAGKTMPPKGLILKKVEY